MKIAVLCLLGVVSARQHHRKTYQTAKLMDNGFIALGQQTFIKKESDWLANGDDADDKEVQSELGDAADPVVMDNGFGLSAGNWADNSWKANNYKGSLNDFVQLGSSVASKVAILNRKESDWLANGDAKDDLEVQNEFDPADPVVMDNGFGLAAGNWMPNTWDMNQYKGSLKDFVQVDDKLNNGDLFLTETFKEEHPGRIMNAFSKPLDKASDTMYAQMEEMEQDHFYTEDFKNDHPHKLVNSFYQRGDEPDIENLQTLQDLNEIDNYNPRAQARLARYAEFM